MYRSVSLSIWKLYPSHAYDILIMMHATIEWVIVKHYKNNNDDDGDNDDCVELGLEVELEVTERTMLRMMMINVMMN